MNKTLKAVRFVGICLLCNLLIFGMGYLSGLKKGEAAIKDYYMATEALLDMLYNDDSFLDTIGESQEYWDYMIADENLIGIIE